MKYRCKNFANNCPVYNNPIELEEMDDKTKCPACGKNTLEEFVEKKKNPILAKLKTPLVAAIIGLGSLGGAYYCFSGDSCFGGETGSMEVTEKNSSTLPEISPIVTGNVTKPISTKPHVEPKEPVKIEEPVINTELEDEKKRLAEEKRLEKKKKQRQKEAEEQAKREAELKKQKEDEEKNRTYSLRVIRSPSNAKVTILKVKPSYDYGQDRVMLTKGNYDIKVSKDGYRPKTVHVTIPKRGTSITVNLEEIIQEYFLTIHTDPSNATVKVDGARYRDGMRLRRDTYNVTVSAGSCYERKSFSVTLNKNRTLNTSLDYICVIPSPTPTPTVRPTQKPISACTQQLKKIESYINKGDKTKANIEIMNFDVHTKDCTASEEARRDTLSKIADAL